MAGLPCLNWGGPDQGKTLNQKPKVDSVWGRQKGLTSDLHIHTCAIKHIYTLSVYGNRLLSDSQSQWDLALLNFLC